MVQPKKILGIDFGERRMGVALTDSSCTLATGYTTIDCKKNPQPLLVLCKIIEEENVASIVVGYPYRTDGKQGGKTEDVDVFIKELQKETALPIFKQDESYTSERAQEIIRFNRPSKKKRKNFKQAKEEIDKIAATLILQDFLDKGEA